MAKQLIKPASLRIDASYKELLHEVKTKIRSAQLQAAFAVNQVLLKFYWEIGSLIIEKQQKAKWGDKLLDTLAEDLKNSFPDTDGFSKPNLKNMRLFAENYPEFEIGQTVSSQLPWSHNIALLRAAKTNEERTWYAKETIENGWSYRQLVSNIRENLYQRQGSPKIKTTNFTHLLPEPQSLLAEEMLKDPYKFHFLTVGKDAHEQEIERGLIAHITQFMLELGQGFAFVGNQFPLIIDKREFRLDLLFYHLKLRSYFVIEIKRGEFKPEHTGKLNFYLSAVDDLLKLPQDNPTIGLLLCEKKNKVFAEYALRDLKKPMGISEYQLAKALPKKLQTSLPTIEEIEAELNMDIDLLKK
ncbi:MAG TPA: PDDEXK nuclease domain-containing protein [Gammaproteobacteria bacterium]|nr:PDDEXK nuclease domain-containing protein [Gammaproteobacteria bacterium]